MKSQEILLNLEERQEIISQMKSSMPSCGVISMFNVR